VSDWAFEAGDPALPYTCGFVAIDDPIYGPSAGVGGYGLVRTRVRLVRVHDAAHPSPSERRATRLAAVDRRALHGQNEHAPAHVTSTAAQPES
jgi:hypothetical protein